jgi:hypothetical protein
VEHGPSWGDSGVRGLRGQAGSIRMRKVRVSSLSSSAYRASALAPAVANRSRQR